MKPDSFHGHTVVIITSARITLPPCIGVPVKVLNNSVTDEQLGLLYQMTAVTIYPSRWEGFGLPVLEAYWSESPLICCHGAGAVPEVAGNDAAFFIGPDRPDELCATVSSLITSRSSDRLLAGLKRVYDFTPEKQLNAFLECVQAVLKSKFVNMIPLPPMASNNLPGTTVTEVTNIATPEATPAAPVAPFTGINLIVQYFNCADNAERQDEFDYCVKSNLQNASVCKVHCLIEPDTVIPEWLSSNPKYVEFKVLTRLTYKTAVDYANRYCSGQICAISNLDIFLDHNSQWNTLPGLFDMSIVMCLARHEFDGISSSTKDKNLQNLAYAASQDCWMFQAPLFVKDCDFTIGLLGCDNAFAHRLRASGYIPVNAQDDYKVHHFDICRGKTGANFTAHHKPNPEQPEERGYRLLPAYGAVQSIDKLLTDLKLGDIQKYLIVCDIMSNFMRLNNPKPSASAAD
jgi:hypothetical protein